MDKRRKKIIIIIVVSVVVVILLSPVIHFYMGFIVNTIRHNRFHNVNSLHDIANRLERIEGSFFLGDRHFTMPYYVESGDFDHYRKDYAIYTLNHRRSSPNGFSVTLNSPNPSFYGYESIELGHFRAEGRDSMRSWRKYFADSRFGANVEQVENFQIKPDTRASHNNFDFIFSLYRLNNTEPDRIYDLPFRVFFALIVLDGMSFSVAITIYEHNSKGMEELLAFCFDVATKHFALWMDGWMD